MLPNISTSSNNISNSNIYQTNFVNMTFSFDFVNIVSKKLVDVLIASNRTPHYTTKELSISQYLGNRSHYP